MQRRDLLKLIATATGCALVGMGGALAAPSASASQTSFSKHDRAMLDEIAETILPRTDTPGAKDAAVGAFIARYALACYDPAQLRILQHGIITLDVLMRAKNGAGFLQASPAQRQALLTDIDLQARQHAKASGEAPPHYFTLMKQLTLLGFYTSEPGSTRVLRYRPVPGKYRGCVPYKKGDTSWA
jgi:hypothetical protein